VGHSAGGDQPARDADQKYYYWGSSFDIYRCPIGGCGAVPEVVASDSQATFLRVDKTHAYWLDSVGIESAPLDGSETPKLLVPLTEERALAVSDSYLYWSVGSQVFRCSTAGCGAAPPTLLVSDESDISGLKIADETMYWLAGNSLHSCQLPDCEQPQLITPPAVAKLYGYRPTENFAIDADSVYWLEQQDSPYVYDLRGKAIRRTPR